MIFLSLKKFYNLLKYINFRSKYEKLQTETVCNLDILYTYDEKTLSTYRLTISGLNEINGFIENNMLLKNHTIFSKQVRIFMSQDETDNNSTIKLPLVLINKVKFPDKFIALDEYDMRIKLSEENQVNSDNLSELLNLTDSERSNIGYRYKQRASLIIESNSEYEIRIDLTDVKSTHNLKFIIDSISTYELEAEVTFKKSIDSETLNIICNKMAELMMNLEQFIQESHSLITRTESINVIRTFNKLAYDDENDNYKDLPAMQSSSVEVQHILDYIPGNYTVTDKADGERYFLMINNDQIYLISGNLDVKKIQPTILLTEKKLSVYNQTVLDGEYMYVAKYKKFMFLTFDILFFQGKDVRNDELLKNRLLLSTKVLKDVFGIELMLGTYTGEYNMSSIVDFHKTNIQNHMMQLNKHLNSSGPNQIINGKYFIFPMTAGTQYEIYTLSTILYESYVLNTSLNCPYVLDGMIYTPINQKYTRNQRETKFKILKWKPETKNSIDLFVRIERNPDTKKILTVYDRTHSNALEKYLETTSKTDIDFTDMTEYKVESNVYQIFNLFVGRMKNNQEIPVPFLPDDELNQAFIYLSNDFPRDIEGNIIQDQTVVEFAYNNTSDLENKFRWIPLRTRYDKTESVQRYRRKYGNNIEIATKIWNSIQNPVTFNDIKLLGNAHTNLTHIKLLKTKISSETISAIRRDDKYYQLVTNLGKSLRSFHNWIKSNIIYTYCARKILLDNTKATMDVLDVGTGRGGDLLKLYHAKVKSAVCIDVNEAGITSGSDGAISRYEEMKKKMPGFPKMSFMVADAGQKLDYENQSKIGQFADSNNKLLKQIFGSNESSEKYFTFDVFNAQFMIHYLLANADTWNNFCWNVNRYLRSDGYLLITTLDGQMVNNSFVNGHITRDSITEDGQRHVLFDIIKKYPDNLDLNNLNTFESNLGIQIDVHLDMFMDEGVYQTEYLVNPSFLIKELKTKCNMRLIETESFQNLYYVYEEFFSKTAKYESKLETRKFFEDVKQFYNQNDPTTRNWFEYSKLNRYYIFQKKT